MNRQTWAHIHTASIYMDNATDARYKGEPSEWERNYQRAQEARRRAQQALRVERAIGENEEAIIVRSHREACIVSVALAEWMRRLSERGRGEWSQLMQEEYAEAQRLQEQAENAVRDFERNDWR